MLEHFGHEVIVFERRNADFSKLNVFEKISFFLRDITWSSRAYKAIKEIIRAKRPDVVHVHNIFFMISPSVYTACQEEGVPVVQTLHNYRFLCPVGTFFRKGSVCEDCLKFGKKAAILHRCWKNSFILTFLLVRILKTFERRADFLQMIGHFIVLSKFSRTKYTAHGFPKDRISVKANFIDFDPGASREIGMYALYVGTLRDYKGIETLMQAWRSLDHPIPLKIVGGGPLRNMVRSFSRIANIESLGERPLNETMHVIKEARFVIVPSECYENFPRVLVEAFACGVPVIGSKIGAIEELIEHGHTGLLFKPGDVDELARAIKILLTDTELLVRMKERSRHEYEMKYSAKENHDRLIEIYEKAIASVSARCVSSRLEVCA